MGIGLVVVAVESAEEPVVVDAFLTIMPLERGVMETIRNASAVG